MTARQRNSLDVIVSDEAREFLGSGIALHRYANARNLMASLGFSLAEMGARIGRDYSFATAYLGNIPRKKLGEKTSRLIETAFGLSEYSLDAISEESPSESVLMDPSLLAQATYAQSLISSVQNEEKRHQLLALIQVAVCETITIADMRMLLLMARHMHLPGKE